jgi:hypothetical protein
MSKSSLLAKAAHLRGCATISLMAINTIWWTALLLSMTFCKAVVPVGGWRIFTGRCMVGLANAWIACNNGILRLVNKVQWRFQPAPGLGPLAQLPGDLQPSILDRHPGPAARLFAPHSFLRFFLKQNLIYVPLLGQAWWALDFPFVKRGSKRSNDLKKQAGPSSLDFVTKACAKYREIPVSIMNFVEGTRFTHMKQQKQASQYANLLKPKAGGVTTVLSAMPDCLHSILDVTIAYPGGAGSFWEFICSRGRQVVVHVEERKLAGLITDQRFRDEGFRSYMEGFLNDMWAAKDRKLAEMAGQA